MNRATFFDAIRPAFGGNLDQGQVIGMSVLLDAGHALPMHHMANVLAQVRRETGGIMAPIKETVAASHKNRNPSDAEVISRLDRAFSGGKLPWVKTPYWRDGWFGRGQIQITHKSNYAKFGITNKDDALQPNISAHVAVVGMREGKFTGKKLSDYSFPADLDNPAKTNPRRIVNGLDGSDKDVAVFHRQFAAALQKAGWGQAREMVVLATSPARPVGDQPLASKPVADIPAPKVSGGLAALFAELAKLIREIVRRFK